MKRVALVFVIAVILPSLVLAWLALRSLRDQQFLLERQQSLLCQRSTDALAKAIADRLAQQEQEFSAQVEGYVGDGDARAMASQFDSQIRKRWPLADVGFCVTLSGRITCPSPNAGPEAQRFLLDNSGFLGNREAVEVYLNNGVANNGNNSINFARNSIAANGANSQSLDTTALAQPQPLLTRGTVPAAAAPATVPSATLSENFKQEREEPAKKGPATSGSFAGASLASSRGANSDALATTTAAEPAPSSQYNLKGKAQARKVVPQQVASYQSLDRQKDVADDIVLSKAVPAEAEFAQLVGNDTDGMFARFLQNKLRLMFWHRLNREPDLVFGAQLNLNRVVDGLRDLIQPDPALNEVCIVLLDDNARPVALSHPKFQAMWKRPFVATEIGDALPHWEVAAYLIDPASLNRTACIAEISLGLLIAVLVLAIVIGSWLIVRNLDAELRFARQKTDFVSNVSHELKTPLTSIRMFSELLAEGRVADQAKQRSYLQIITAEAARLTRLINNVLDFSRLERGEKKYDFKPCDVAEIVRSACDTFRPHLEANGFQFGCECPSAPVTVRGDADALSQVIVNLLSNAEKYSDGGKEVRLQVVHQTSPLPHVAVKVLDRGAGVPRGCEEKVFEKFYRAHDSLSSGIQGSGLGLTIARQIARAHGGDVTYERRDGGGSCFVLRLPILTTDAK